MDYLLNTESLDSKRRLYDILKSLTGIRLVKIEKYSKKRSSPQNRYYHAVVLKYLSEVTGYSVEEMHEVCKLKFMPYERVNRATGEVQTFGKSTTGLNTAEFEEYLDNIRIWAINDLDCLIPLPNEVII